MLTCGISQAQAGWLQHDLGHLSVFKSRELNLLAHRFVIIHLKAASSAWWNYRHYLHHAKPNIAEADPGMRLFMSAPSPEERVLLQF
jgi:fatty acid desaturase